MALSTTVPLQESLFKIDTVSSDAVIELGQKTEPKTEATLISRSTKLNKVPNSDVSSLPPMLRHYLEVKAKFQDRVVFYQVGDFFEVFFDDAIRVSDCLSIRLTSRDKDQENPIPMCGVPIHAFNGYLNKLLASGIGCVLVEQTEDASQAKGLVKRDITRILTPGVVFESENEDLSHTNHIISIVPILEDSFACSIMEASTGSLYLYKARSIDEVVSLVIRYQVKEVVIKKETQELRINLERILQGVLSHPICISEYEVDEDYEFLNSRVVIQKEKLAELNLISQSRANELKHSMYLLLGYILFVSRSEKILISSITSLQDSCFMILDGATVKNLEILQTFEGAKDFSLVGVIDKTKTALGSRKLKEWILSPLIDDKAINNRLDKVESLVKNQELLKSLRQDLYAVKDLERICTKLISGKVSPYDVGLLQKSLSAVPEIGQKIEEKIVTGLDEFVEVFKGIPDLVSLLDSALLDNLPARLGEGAVFKDSYNEELKRLRELETNSKNIISKIEQEEKIKTGISSLKIKYNSVLGYFIEIGASHSNKAPSEYIKKQTLSNVERYFTQELKNIEKDILSARSKIENIERDLFFKLKETCLAYITEIQKIGEHIGIFDCICSFAFLAIDSQYVRPTVNNDLVSHIKKGRHPVIEKIIGRAQFVPNDLNLSGNENYFSILTGPNMGGKSTYLKQAGIIHIMAQAGSFVPAEVAKIGVVDQIFTRIGAGDNLSRGESTFMVEMKEASHILSAASKKSLVLVDELGRGTATVDGYALALSIAEWLINEIKSRTVFATHFHELNSLEKVFSKVNCLSVGIIETAQRIEFTHMIENRAAEKSYGIHVAELAGVPKQVLKRARDIADSENILSFNYLNNTSDAKSSLAADNNIKQEKEYKELRGFIEALANKDPDTLSPKDALEVIYEVVELAKRLNAHNS